MIPVVSSTQMRTADAVALEAVGPSHVGIFMERAGFATARAAKKMLGGTYGKRVTVIAGKGNNGNDGRIAAQWLQQWGVHVRIVSAVDAASTYIDTDAADLVIDAAYGIGFRGTWTPPIVVDVPVLAVDIPSGLDANTGRVEGGVLVADRTITFAALKFGHLFGDGPSLCGEIDVVDVGIDVHGVIDDCSYLVELHDVAQWLPVRDRQAHKWNHAVRVIAGSQGMLGAASLVCASAMRAGAGMVHVSTRTSPDAALLSLPTEVVHHPLNAGQWAAQVVADEQRFTSLVIGPGLGRGDDIAAEIRGVLAASDLPAVVDGDGIVGAVEPRGGYDTLITRNAPTVLTPHDGEFALLGGDVNDPDVVGATVALANETRCIILRKGPTTIIAAPNGAVYLVASGDERLATAGSGDVLSGVIGAFIARGMDVHEAAAAAAFVHGMAGSSLQQEGAIARDIVGTLADVMVHIAETADRMNKAGSHVG